MTSPRQRIQKRTVTSETQKENPSRRYLRTVRPEPTSGRELTKTRHPLRVVGDPCGGVFEYLHRDPASRRTRREGKSRI
jgi:hypothetical protein